MGNSCFNRNLHARFGNDGNRTELCRAIEHLADNVSGFLSAFTRMNQKDRVPIKLILGITQSFKNRAIGMDYIPLLIKYKEEFVYRVEEGFVVFPNLIK